MRLNGIKLKHLHVSTELFNLVMYDVIDALIRTEFIHRLSVTPAQGQTLGARLKVSLKVNQDI